MGRSLKKRSGRSLKSEPGRKGKCIRNEIDLGYYIQFRLPVEGKIEGSVLKFVVQSNNPGGAQPGLTILETDIAAAAIKPFKGWGGADELMPFIETPDPEPVAKRHQSFHRIAFIHKVFNADGVAQGRGGRTEPDADCHFIILCGGAIAQATGGEKDQAKGDDSHNELFISLWNENNANCIKTNMLELS